LLENALNDLLTQAREINENFRYFGGAFQAQESRFARSKEHWRCVITSSG
jgi:hypothetical protein